MSKVGNLVWFACTAAYMGLGHAALLEFVPPESMPHMLFMMLWVFNCAYCLVSGLILGLFLPYSWYTPLGNAVIFLAASQMQRVPFEKEEHAFYFAALYLGVTVVGMILVYALIGASAALEPSPYSKKYGKWKAKKEEKEFWQSRGRLARVEKEEVRKYHEKAKGIEARINQWGTDPESLKKKSSDCLLMYELYLDGKYVKKNGYNALMYLFAAVAADIDNKKAMDALFNVIHLFSSGLSEELLDKAKQIHDMALMRIGMDEAFLNFLEAKEEYGMEITEEDRRGYDERLNRLAGEKEQLRRLAHSEFVPAVWPSRENFHSLSSDERFWHYRERDGKLSEDMKKQVSDAREKLRYIETHKESMGDKGKAYLALYHAYRDGMVVIPDQKRAVDYLFDAVLEGSKDAAGELHECVLSKDKLPEEMRAKAEALDGAPNHLKALCETLAIHQRIKGEAPNRYDEAKVDEIHGEIEDEWINIQNELYEKEQKEKEQA